MSNLNQTTTFFQGDYNDRRGSGAAFRDSLNMSQPIPYLENTSMISQSF